MTEYITKEQAWGIVKIVARYADAHSIVLADKALADMPAADVVEVVHAKNISDAHPSDEFECLNCGLILRDYCEYVREDDIHYEFTEWNCCPRCGARIDGGEDQ